MGMGGGVEESRRAAWKVLDFPGPATGPWAPPTGTVESLSQAGRPPLLLDDQGWPAGDTWCETRISQGPSQGQARTSPVWVSSPETQGQRGEDAEADVVTAGDPGAVRAT